MNPDIRARRAQLMQASQLADVVARLTAFHVFGPVGWHELPEWVGHELAATRRSDAPPDAVLPENADDTTVRQWIAAFITQAGLGDRFYLLTGIEHFPWLDLATRDDSSLDNLIDLKGYNLTIISPTQALMIVFYEEEHEYQAFQRSAQHRPVSTSA